jgi:hypothetical protein
MAQPPPPPPPPGALAAAGHDAPPWAWNRAFYAAADVRPAAVTPAGDCDFHNAPQLAPGDYAALLLPPPPAPAPAPPALAVYVGTAALPQFVRDVLPAARRAFVLVSGQSDPGPGRVLQAHAAQLAAHPLLRAWYAEMRDFACPPPGCERAAAAGGGGSGGAAAAAAAACCAAAAKVRALPLGLDLHTLAYKPSDRPQWGPPAGPGEQAAQFAAAAAAATHEDARVYVHFGWLPPGRRAVLKLLRGHPAFVCDPARALPREELWRRMGRHRWVLCLQGGGVDCHRTWEAVGLGCGLVAEALPFLQELLLLAPPGAGRRQGGGEAEAGEAGEGGAVYDETIIPHVGGAGGGGPTLRFRGDVPVAMLLAPSAAEVQSPDLAARAAARAAWRGVTQAALDAAWADAAQRRARLCGAAAVRGGQQLLLPAALSARYWRVRIEADCAHAALLGR